MDAGDRRAQSRTGLLSCRCHAWLLSYTLALQQLVEGFAGHLVAAVRVRCGASARRSVAIEINQSLVANPEVMRDLVEHDVSDLAA
jgi:hypothetical protein